ncbi:hypothetical protein M409DRAFT_61939 [Zasmidium cellare ATCC 36951]|uniref:Heterokaryon incompatibility domain-containing protein n=1 Tax=Zasmidium cellare ATCC 36951 TaxID=1080233 RepID=A0A6A6D3G8_ZASCE|nr:uncharacterized protein M409DRAFT_61939 [Zasmidium cellare ATCC 36951]KAF2173595.1 hypothetical protein M409DRAFT_61939 [Zasmidium cellare ATCC 36951]
MYVPLSQEVRQFRLLTIKGGHGDVDLQCSLRTVDLEGPETAKWATVSYCWGDPRERIPLAVNGQTVLVPPNARDAIIRLRLPTQNREVWIDSVCINQADLRERSLQVASMGLIYRRAEGNYIFLGHASGVDTDRIVHILGSGADRIRAARASLNQAQEMGFMTGLVPNEWLLNGVISAAEMALLEPLFQSLWFQRLWVVQEASLAKHNVCLFGGSSFPLEDVLLNASINTKPMSFGLQSTRSVFAAATMRQFAVSSHQPLNLGGEHFLRYFPIIRTMDTTDPRDRVYAVLDLYRHRAGLQSLPNLLVPDYTRPVADVFRAATRHALTEPASGGILSSICHRSDHDMSADGYRSWALRFDRKFSPAEDCLALRSAAATFPTDSVDHRLETADSGDPNVLKLKCWLIGRVTASSITTSSPQFQSVDYDTAKQMVNFVLARSMPMRELAQTYGLDDCYGLAADVLSTGSLGGQDLQFKDRAARRAAFKLYVQHIHQRKTVPEKPRPGTGNDDDYAVFQFHKLMSNTIHRRRCFRVDSGHVGIGPVILREHDCLVICNGAEHPYVLRPCTFPGSFLLQYQFVGAAYVPGLMTGQVFHLNLEQSWFNIQ